MSKPILWIVIPCYNEEQVLPITAPMFLEKISGLAAQGLVSEKSRVLFVNDGSKDKTWELIQSFAAQDEHYIGISQSRNRGHQNAVLAGLMEALHSGTCDVTISIDCDGQDDINAMDEMVKKYLDGAEVVYGVRSRRDTDTFFKRFTAEGFYHVMNALGADIVFNHADYRLISTRVLESFADYREVNIFLRGMVPLVGFKSEVVTYERHERLAGESHYPLSKMLALAFDGITSLSNKPIRIITGAGIAVSLVGTIRDAAAEVHETKRGSTVGVTAKKTGRMILDSLEAGGKGSITVAVACAMAGMIAGCITVTGLASKLISGVVALSSKIPNPTLSLLLALFLTMLCCIVLGMGVPTTANYCIMASTCAPILITLGIPKGKRPAEAVLSLFTLSTLKGGFAITKSHLPSRPKWS